MDPERPRSIEAEESRGGRRVADGSGHDGGRWGLVVLAVSGVFLVLTAAVTFVRVVPASLPSERDVLLREQNEMLCLVAELRGRPAGERYWFGDPTTEPVAELFRQRLVQNAFPLLELADSEEDATVIVSVEVEGGASCGGLRLQTVPVAEAGD